MAVERQFGDGTGSYSFYSGTFTHTSWLPEPNYVYDHAVNKFKAGLNTESDCPIKVASFNRI